MLFFINRYLVIMLTSHCEDDQSLYSFKPDCTPPAEQPGSMTNPLQDSKPFGTTLMSTRYRVKDAVSMFR